jgi:hypothetical protein
VLLLLCGVALPLRGVVLHLPSGVAHGSVGLPVYQVLGLDRFLALGLPRIVLPWPWLLAPVAALLLGAVLIHHRHAALRVSAYALALVLPARLLAADLTLRPSDLVHGLPQVLADTTTVSFGPGWWLVHAAALFSVAALAWEDLRPAR